MNGVLARVIIATPWLAVALPAAAAGIGLLLLWRERRSLGPGWWRRPLTGAVIGTFLLGIPATYLWALGQAFSGSPRGPLDLAVVGFGCAALVSLSSLAGYSILRVRDPANVGLGILLGPLVLIGIPLAASPILLDFAQPIIRAGFEEAALARGATLDVAIERVRPTIVDDTVEAVDLRLTIRSEQLLNLVSSDSDIDWGLIQIRLVPPEGPTALLAAQSPVGEPRYLDERPVTYELSFDGERGIARSTGDWIVRIELDGNGEPYTWEGPLPIVATSE